VPAVAVTAATGRLGRLVVEELLARGVPAGEVVAVVRTPARAADLAAHGVLVREGDYDRPETLRRALDGVDQLLLISGSDVGRRVAQHATVIDAAREAGVGRIAYTSILRADTTTNPLAPDHRATEEALRSSGLPLVLLRNSWYTENYTARLTEYLATGEILGAAGTGRIAAATRADYAAAAAAVLTGDPRGSAVHELAGPGFTMAQLAASVTEVTGAPVTYRDLEPAELVSALQAAGLDAGTAAFVTALDESAARGDLDAPDTDLVRLIGRPATSLTDALRAAAPA
jgi:NAD(P)H dehydrogenase (quinone)